MMLGLRRFMLTFTVDEGPHGLQMKKLDFGDEIRN